MLPTGPPIFARPLAIDGQSEGRISQQTVHNPVALFQLAFFGVIGRVQSTSNISQQPTRLSYHSRSIGLYTRVRLALRLALLGYACGLPCEAFLACASPPRKVSPCRRNNPHIFNTTGAQSRKTSLAEVAIGYSPSLVSLALLVLSLQKNGRWEL